MEKKTVREALIALNGGIANIGYAEENLWFNEKPEYAGFTAKLKEFMAAENFRGSALIATDEEIIWASGTRSKDIYGDTVSPLTTFEIGSLTKAFTAACLFKLVDAGKLSLSDKVVKYFPAFTKAGEMTVYDLLHMRSGIVDFANEFEIFFGKDEALKEMFEKGEMVDEVLFEHLYQLDLKCAPGTKMEYCNTNYTLLAMIVEQLTGKTYREAVSEMIFTPLGMTATSATAMGDVTSVPEEEGGYMKEQLIARGAGDIHTTMPDLLRFDRALFGGRLVSRESKEAIFSFVDSYGCGWMEAEDHEDVIYHGGGTTSYISFNCAYHASGPRTYLLTSSPCHDEETPEKLMALCREQLQVVKKAQAEQPAETGEEK